MDDQEYIFPEGHFGINSTAITNNATSKQITAAFVDWVAEDVTLELIYQNDNCKWEAQQKCGCSVSIQNVDPSDEDESIFFIEKGHPTVFFHAVDSGVTVFQFCCRNLSEHNTAAETAFELEITADNEGVIQSVEARSLDVIPSAVIKRSQSNSVPAVHDDTWTSVELKNTAAKCSYCNDQFIVELDNTNDPEFAWAFVIYGYAVVNLCENQDETSKLQSLTFKGTYSDRTKIEFYHKNKSVGTEHMSATFSLTVKTDKAGKIVSIE